MKVYCVSITFLVSFEWSGKVLKRQGVKGLKGEIWGVGIRGEKAQSLAKRSGRERMEEKSEPARSKIGGCGTRPGDQCLPPACLD